MIYLLDVNALVALGFQQHQFHERVASWVRTEGPSGLATCSITELGFVRVLSQAAAYGLSINQARALLLRLKQSVAPQILFLPDNHDVSHLPARVKTAAQVSDGHLAELAKAHTAVLGTLDPEDSRCVSNPGKMIGASLTPELLNFSYHGLSSHPASAAAPV